MHIDILKSYDIQNPTQNQKSVIKQILEKYDNYQDEVCKLLEKILNSQDFKDDEISKQAIKFLTDITDNDLEFLKEQFRYIVFSAVICSFKYNDYEVQKYLETKEITRMFSPVSTLSDYQRYQNYTLLSSIIEKHGYNIYQPHID